MGDGLRGALRRGDGLLRLGVGLTLPRAGARADGEGPRAAEVAAVAVAAGVISALSSVLHCLKTAILFLFKNNTKGMRSTDNVFVRAADTLLTQCPGSAESTGNLSRVLLNFR